MRGAVAVSGELPGVFWGHQAEQRAPRAVCVLLSWSHGARGWGWLLETTSNLGGEGQGWGMDGP